MMTMDTTDQQTLSERMRWETERFLERASRSTMDPRRAYERLVRRLHGQHSKPRGEREARCGFAVVIRPPIEPAALRFSCEKCATRQ